MLRYTARAAALERFLKQDDHNNRVCLRRLDEMTVRVVEGQSWRCCVSSGRYIAHATHGTTTYKMIFAAWNADSTRWRWREEVFGRDKHRRGPPARFGV